MSGKNLRVNLIANTSQFKSAMSETSNQIKLLNSEFKSAAAETDQYGNKLDTTGAKKKQLNGVIQQYTQRVKAIKEEQKHWTRELEKGNITEEEHAQKQTELARRLNNTEGEMKKYEGQLKKLNSEGKEVRKTYQEFDKQFRDVGQTMRDTGAQVGIAAGVGFVAMKRILSDVVNEAKTFEAGMSRVKAISGATGDEMAAMNAQALELNKTTVFTAEQAAAGMEKLALAGWKSADIMSAMPGMLDLAAAGALELATAADITSDTMQAFSLSSDKATHAADVFAYAQANANTNVEQMGEAMKYIAPTANSLGWSLEEASSIIMTLADNGLKGSMATQAFGTSLVKLSAPTPKATKLIKKLGMEFFDANGKMKSMPEVVAEMEKGLKGMSDKQKAATMDTLIGKNAFKQWQIILKEGSKTLADTTKNLENADGAAKDMAETMLDNAHGAIVRMQSALSALKIELGEKLLPIISKGAEFVGNLANKFSEMDEETITTIAHTALLVTAVLGVTTAVAGLVAGIGAFMMVAGPVGLAITAGTLLLGGMAAAAYKNRLETEKLAEEQEQATEDAIRYGEGLSEGTKKAVKGYVDLYEGAKVKMLELKNMSGDEAKKTSAEIVKAFSEMADAVIAELETQKEKLTVAINEVYAVAGEAGVKAAGELSDKVLAAYDADIAEYKKALDVIKEVQEKFSGDLSKAPKELQESYAKSLEIMGGGAREFAKSQDELRIIQQNIAERQGGILYAEVEAYTKRIKDSYAESIKAALNWNEEKKEVFDQGLSQGKISAEEYNSLMASTEATTSKMIAESVKEQEKSLDALADNLDARGKLIDLATGEEFERKTWLHENSAGVRTLMEESELDYYERWKEHNKKVVDDTVKYSEATLGQQKKTLVAALEALGMTNADAVKEAEKLMKDTLSELDKGEKEAKDSGKKKGEAHKEGLESTKKDNEKAADNVSKVSKDFLDLDKWRNDSKDAGRKKGDAHKEGLESTKGKNESSAGSLSGAVSAILGRTTDGGGGSVAGSLFSAGITSWTGRVKSSGTNVAKSGRSGLQSVSTSGAGSDFVAGFRGSISSGSGSVWNTAWSLGKSALSALKRSIDSRSPAKLTRVEGMNFTDGFRLAIDDGKKGTVRAAAMVGKESVEALNEEVKGFKQSFGAIALAVEGNKQTLKVEHTLDKKFDEFASMFMSDKTNNDSFVKELLNATLQQNQLLMQLLQKNTNIIMNDRILGTELEPVVTEIQNRNTKINMAFK